MDKKYSALVLFLIVVSFFLHFWGLEHPNAVVFDEVYYGKFAGFYFNGKYYFDIHPSLGKLIIATGGTLTGFKPGFGFENIGLTYPDFSYYGMRLFPAFIGSLLPLVVFFLIKRLGGSIKIAILGMLLVILENSMLVQSRMIHPDVILLFFGLCGLLFYLKARVEKIVLRRLIYLAAAGIFIGATISIKWTGLVFWVLVFILSLVSLKRHFTIKRNFIKPLALFVGAIIIIPLLFYVSIFAIHFSLLPNSGEGDAFMTQRFQSTLFNNTNYNSSVQVGFLEKFVELNKEMLAANSRITSDHPYAAKWYEMPLMGRPIYYWNKADGNLMARIYLIGNPFVWWIILVGIIFFIGALMLWIIKRKWAILKKKEVQIALLIVYLLNLFTFAFISRAYFLYHYFPSLVIGILIFCLLFDKFLVDKKSRGRYIYWTIIGLTIFGFLYFSPLTFGWYLDENTYNLLVWFGGWK